MEKRSPLGTLGLVVESGVPFEFAHKIEQMLLLSAGDEFLERTRHCSPNRGEAAIRKSAQGDFFAPTRRRDRVMESDRPRWANTHGATAEQVAPTQLAINVVSSHANHTQQGEDSITN